MLTVAADVDGTTLLLPHGMLQALDDMEELHVKRSNAGAIQDDEDETRRKEEQVSATSMQAAGLF